MKPKHSFCCFWEMQKLKYEKNETYFLIVSSPVNAAVWVVQKLQAGQFYYRAVWPQAALHPGRRVVFAAAQCFCCCSFKHQWATRSSENDSHWQKPFIASLSFSPELIAAYFPLIGSLTSSTVHDKKIQFHFLLRESEADVRSIVFLCTSYFKYLPLFL